MKKNIPIFTLAFFLLMGISLAHSDNNRVKGNEEKTLPGIEMDFGLELFAKKEFEKCPFRVGLAAFMIDLGVKASDKFWGFAALHFDSKNWHSFLNRSFEAKESDGDFGIELHLEELFVAWNPLKRLEIKAGRRYSRISRANSLHLSEFEFNTKPRVLTKFFGDNHGLAIDGICGQMDFEFGGATINILSEIGRNNREASGLIISNSIEAVFENKNSTLGLKGFTIFDKQQNENPWFSNNIPKEYHNQLNLTEGVNLNSFGLIINYSTKISKGLSLQISAEGLTRKLGNKNFYGGFGFTHFKFNNKFAGGIMLQDVNFPHFEYGSLNSIREKATTLGLSWYPDTNKRLNLEWSTFSNSPFYNNMVLMKYTLILGAEFGGRKTNY